MVAKKFDSSCLTGSGQAAVVGGRRREIVTDHQQQRALRNGKITAHQLRLAVVEVEDVVVRKKCL